MELTRSSRVIFPTFVSAIQEASLAQVGDRKGSESGSDSGYPATQQVQDSAVDVIIILDKNGQKKETI